MCGRPDILYPCSRMIKVCFCHNHNIINSSFLLVQLRFKGKQLNSHYRFFKRMRLAKPIFWISSPQDEFHTKRNFKTDWAIQAYRSVLFCNGVVYIIFYERAIFSYKGNENNFRLCVCWYVVFDNDRTGLLLKIIEQIINTTQVLSVKSRSGLLMARTF